MDASITTVFYLHYTQTHCLLQKPLISPLLLLAGDLSGHFENAVNSKLFCPQHNCVTTPFPADTFLVFSPTNKICEEKAKTENLISPHLCTGPHRASPATDGRRASSFVTSSAHRSQLSTTTAALREQTPGKKLVPQLRCSGAPHHQ